MTGLSVATRMAGYAALARDSGRFAMLALDQRGSLETLFRDVGLAADEPHLDAFRAAARDALVTDASAILLERGFLSRGGSARPWAGPCSLIVAADELIQPDGQPLQASLLDPPAADLAVELGATALKLLVLWHAGEANATQLAMVDAFVELAHERSLLAVVEGIVRAPTGTTASATNLLEAASALSARADIYKAQVPIHGGDRPADVEALSRELTEIVPCPWVVLSAGVDAARFPEYVAASCRGGASGFLAGRGIWGDSLRAADRPDHLRRHAVARLWELDDIVDAAGRPWSDVPMAA